MNSFFSSIVAECSLRAAFHSPHKASANMLAYLLTGSSKTIFGTAHGLKASMSIDEFRNAVPIRTYDDFKPWINRIVAGEWDVLWPGRPSAFGSTSGTTSESKILPITSDFIRDYHLGNLLTLHRMMIHAPRSVFHSVLTLGGPSEEERIGDIPIGSISGILYETLPSLLNSRLVIPSQVHNIPDQDEKLYIISRLALEATISGIITVIPATLFVLYELINSTADRLINEIAQGSMRPLTSTPQHLRAYLLRRSRPNHRRASELREFIHRDGKLLPFRIWPLAGLCTYTKQAQPAQWKLIHDLYGNMPLIDPGLVATEGRVSVGLYPNKEHHAVLPLSSFVELIPLDVESKESLNAGTLLPYQAEVGKLYCPVISSANGLMRYKLEDVICVNSMSNGIPLIEYIGRLDDSLSIAGEKVSDAHIRAVLDRIKEIGVCVDGVWAVGISWEGSKPFYQFIWETNEPFPQLAEQMDATLQLLNVSYRRKRAQSLLLPLRATPVQPGQIHSYDTHVRWIGQSKPRVLFRRSSGPPASTTVLRN